VVGAVLALAVAAAFVGGCGGGQKSAPPAEAAAPPATDEEGDEDVLVPPEKFDEINQVLTRKQPVVSRCFSTAMEDGKIDKDAKGTVTVGLKISTGGEARDVRVTESTLKSSVVEECVVKEIGEARFSAMPKQVEYSYTYRFERDY
jgi:hypothetical protein